ncbi:hypothetical protein evm_014451 [Chilo suppressalis]|nr:hypothetical protein evm_014451 [Chilo suppressalis]
MDEADNILCIQKSEAHHPRQRAKKNTIPRREPSIVIPERQIVYITPDKTTCAECACFPKEDPYVKLKKLNPCQKSPITLYELAAKVVDALRFPAAFSWSVEEVAEWIENIVAYEQTAHLMVSDHRRPWTLATPRVSQMRCRPLRKEYALFLKIFGSY